MSSAFFPKHSRSPTCRWWAPKRSVARRLRCSKSWKARRHSAGAVGRVTGSFGVKRCVSRRPSSGKTLDRRTENLVLVWDNVRCDATGNDALASLHGASGVAANGSAAFTSHGSKMPLKTSSGRLKIFFFLSLFITQVWNYGRNQCKEGLLLLVEVMAMAADANVQRDESSKMTNFRIFMSRSKAFKFLFFFF